ncbi:hypothetical protein [Endozoicomonas sp. ISHI1]|uniref:hypothetical protein n=1 Tax=Endozoicomonas sp. ISHI1 TaxID=2825882 RepID=UPI002148ED1E|nr:hypothetical protein [Endozoicomonas sp. ISHI1]
MDQVVKPTIVQGSYNPQCFEMEIDSLPINKADDNKYLTDAAEHTRNQIAHKDLLLRSISLVPTEKDKNNYYIDLAKNIVFNLDKTFFDSIDEESWKNMADGLKFSGIDSLEKATAMDLRVCPPCPVFHTWAALHGTTIFNGLNNPEGLKGIDYVQRILEEGSSLSKNDIPLLIVFSNMSLTESQIQEMKAEFISHDNILCISLETDLQLKFPIPLNKYASSMSLEFMDSIRVVVSQNIANTLSFCIDKASSENKPKLANRLEKLGVNHLFYSDIDNQWLSKPPYILARHGMFTLPKMPDDILLKDINGHTLTGLSDIDRKRLVAHRSFFSDLPHLNKRKSKIWSTDKARKLFNYIFSGEAERNYQYLATQIGHISHHYYDLLKPANQVVSWKGDNGCLFMTEHSKDDFLRAASKRVSIIDLHEEPNNGYCFNPDPYYREAHSLVGMQLLKYYYYGHDYTWRQ